MTLFTFRPRHEKHPPPLYFFFAFVVFVHWTVLVFQEFFPFGSVTRPLVPRDPSFTREKRTRTDTRSPKLGGGSRTRVPLPPLPQGVSIRPFPFEVTLGTIVGGTGGEGSPRILLRMS